MELLGLALAFPAVLVANVAYSGLAQFLMTKTPWVRPWLVWPSWVVLGLLVADVVLVATIGAVSSRRALGPTFWTLHLLVVLLGAPALANLLLSPESVAWYRRWYVVAAVCFVVGILLVFFQVGVGDALFGPDGIGGPFATGA
jgi:hypothetical protein